MAAVKKVVVNEWTRGRAVGFIPYSWFHKDETALLNPPREVMFFQTFGLEEDFASGYAPPGPESQTWPSQDYDIRWRWTVLLMPNCTGHGNSSPLSWKVIEELKAKRIEEERVD